MAKKAAFSKPFKFIMAVLLFIIASSFLIQLFDKKPKESKKETVTKTDGIGSTKDQKNNLNLKKQDLLIGQEFKFKNALYNKNDKMIHETVRIDDPSNCEISFTEDKHDNVYKFIVSFTFMNYEKIRDEADFKEGEMNYRLAHDKEGQADGVQKCMQSAGAVISLATRGKLKQEDIYAWIATSLGDYLSKINIKENVGQNGLPMTRNFNYSLSGSDLNINAFPFGAGGSFMVTVE